HCGWDRADEADALHTAIRDERLTRIRAIAAQDADDTGREDLGADFGKNTAGQRSLLRRLDDNSVAGDERCREPRRGEVEWMVEGNDACHNAERLAHTDVQMIGRRGVGGPQ